MAKNIILLNFIFAVFLLHYCLILFKEKMKNLKKLELVKKSVVELGKKQSRALKGGASSETYNTHKNTCALSPCCNYT